MAFTKHQLVIFAARSGNLPLLRERVRNGGDINCLDPKHGAPLMAAIRSDHVAAVRWLLANGADVNAKYGDQFGPLEVALYHPNPEVVGVLLEHGARLFCSLLRPWVRSLTSRPVPDPRPDSSWWRIRCE
jgi:ankyrin repeat protein